MATIKLQDGKVVLKDGKASCACCGECCSLFNCESLLEYWKGNGHPIGYKPFLWEYLITKRPDPDDPPNPDWERDHGINTGDKGSCIRFVCIKSVFSDQGGSELTSESYCGPSCTNLDLFNTIVSNVDGAIFEQTACFIFAIIFYGWVEEDIGEDGKRRRRFKQCSDTAFAIHYAKLIKE